VQRSINLINGLANLPSVFVSVMQVWIMRMLMLERFVGVRMRMRLQSVPAEFVGMNPYSGGHQQAGSDQRDGHRRAQSHRDSRADKGRE
jgi:hypothetical protein